MYFLKTQEIRLHAIRKVTQIFRFELISPERLLFSETVREVIIPGSEGEFSIMANHTPLIARVIPGLVRIIKCNEISDKNEYVFVSFGGFMNFTKGECSLLAEFISPLEKVEKKDIEQQILVAREELKTVGTDVLRNKVEEYIYHLASLYNNLVKIKDVIYIREV